MDILALNNLHDYLQQMKWVVVNKRCLQMKVATEWNTLKSAPPSSAVENIQIKPNCQFNTLQSYQLLLEKKSCCEEVFNSTSNQLYL